MTPTDESYANGEGNEDILHLFLGSTLPLSYELGQCVLLQFIQIVAVRVDTDFECGCGCGCGCECEKSLFWWKLYYESTKMINDCDSTLYVAVCVHGVV